MTYIGEFSVGLRAAERDKTVKISAKRLIRKEGAEA
jgi:hypothetical protein